MPKGPMKRRLVTSGLSQMLRKLREGGKSNFGGNLPTTNEACNAIKGNLITGAPSSRASLTRRNKYLNVIKY